jgi:multiple sugar transport system substrate-binding protein
MDKSQDTANQTHGTIAQLDQPQDDPQGLNYTPHSFYEQTTPQSSSPATSSVEPLKSESIGEDPIDDMNGEEIPVAQAQAPAPQQSITPNPFRPPSVGSPSQSSPNHDNPLPPPPDEGMLSRFPLGLIGKIALGIVALFIVSLIIWKGVLPLFAKKQPVPVTLTYWGLWEEPRVMQAVFDDFTKQYPYIKINYTREDIKEYRQRLTTRIPLGNGPDLFRFHNSWYPMIASDLAPFPKGAIDTNALQQSYFPVVQSDTVKNGAVYGVPLGIDTLALFVNDDILSAAGQTVPTSWDEFIKVAKAITVKDQTGKIQTSGAALGTYDNITHASDIVALIMMQNGADFSNLSGTKEQAAEALSFYTSFAKDTNNVWDSSQDDSINEFAAGKLGMYIGYSWDIFTIQAMNPSLKFSTHVVPNLPGKSLDVASYWIEGVSSKSLHQKEAFMLLSYLQQKETLEKLYTETAKTRAFGELYPRSDLSSLLKQNSLVYPFVQQGPIAVSTYFMSSTYDSGGINDQMNAYLGNAVRSVLQSTSPDSAVDTLSNGVSQVLHQYGQ